MIVVFSAARDIRVLARSYRFADIAISTLAVLDRFRLALEAATLSQSGMHALPSTSYHGYVEEV